MCTAVCNGSTKFSGLNQFIDIVVCGQHGWLFCISEIGTFFIGIMAILSILTIASCTHIFKESQYFHIVRCWFSQFIQFSGKNQEKEKEKKSNIKKSLAGRKDAF